MTIGRVDSYDSWGGYPRSAPSRVFVLDERPELPTSRDTTLLPYGNGRSYGDVCLNNGGTLLATRRSKMLLDADWERGVVRCQAGMTIGELNSVSLPHGWLVGVTPGTQLVTLGGALANDVHGKNHHGAGSFGCHLLSFELMRSDGTSRVCSAIENVDFFFATIGGLGLTGLVSWLELALKRVPGPFLAVDTIKYANLDEFARLSDESSGYEYTVAWIDCNSLSGRGVFQRADHVEARNKHLSDANAKIELPFTPPFSLVGSVTTTLFNAGYFGFRRACVSAIQPLDKFLYPLDNVGGWNRIYGRRGFVQFQCVIPGPEGYSTVARLLAHMRTSRMGSFLTVLKHMGEKRSGGYLSFPRAGITLAVDFPYRGEPTRRLLARLEDEVLSSNGAIYPAKDALMSTEAFEALSDCHSEFRALRDCAFESDFIRRVQPGV
ncbi:MAG: FAD-binding oxidoreductase [Gammaproteobacteria bacterium]|nr:FAD-binding oxidoreductase [Gammaproteobacteria bacterium]